MVEKEVIKVLVPDDTHLEIVRGSRANEATHKTLSLFELEMVVILVRKHVLAALKKKYGEDVEYELTNSSWRDIMGGTGMNVRLIVHLPAGGDLQVVVGRDSVWNISIFSVREWEVAEAKTKVWAKEIESRRAH